MVYAVAVLLISSLTLIGLLAIWAATFQANWFWRTMIYLGMLSPLLLIPASEPLIAFVLLGVIVAVGVTWIPWQDAKRPVGSTNSSRFSLRDLLLVLVPISIVAASVSISFPSLNLNAWQSIISVSMVGGFGAFTGWWMGTRKAKSWWVRFGIGVTVCGLIASVAARCDWFIICIDSFTEWPPNETEIGGSIFTTYKKGENANIWYFILGVQILFTNYLIQESASIYASIRSQKWYKYRNLAIANFVFLLAIVTAPSLVVGYKFLTRNSVPDISPPEPNGYVEFLAARDLVPKVGIIEDETFSLWEATEAELREASKELDAALTRVDLGLHKPTSVLIDYFDPEYPEDLLDDLRTLRLGIYIQGAVLLSDNDVESAANRFLDLIAFASASSRGGFTCHDHVSTRTANLGFRELFQCINQLPRQSIPKFIKRLQHLQAEYEPAENYVLRTDIWIQRCRGWYGHLESIFGEEFLPSFFEMESYLMDRRHISTIFHLMQTELAIRAYKIDHQEWPKELTNLVPEYLPQVLTDPHTSSNEPLRYLRGSKGYLLYSVGPNGKDDQGEKARQSLSYAVHGDTSLKDQYGEVESSE